MKAVRSDGRDGQRDDDDDDAATPTLMMTVIVGGARRDLNDNFDPRLRS